MRQVTTPNKQWFEDFYVYDVDFFSLAPGASDNGNIQIQADSDFKWERAAFFASIAGGAQTLNTLVMPLITLQMTDTGSGRNLFQTPIPITNVFGTGQLPFVLPLPRIFRARSSITFAVTNTSAATTYDLNLSLIGYKLFEA